MRKRILDLTKITKNAWEKDESYIEYEIFTFPDGQPHIKILSDVSNDKVVISTRILNPTDLILLALAVDVLRQKSCYSISLGISYLMGGRMDRRISRDEPFTLKVIARFINSLEFEWVHLLDPHSDMSVGLIDNAVLMDNHLFISKVLEDFVYNPVLAAPDVGAAKKTFDLAAKHGGKMIQCMKHRDMKTGKLSHFSVDVDDLKGQHVLVVDDICDGGGTFVGLAKVLREKNAGDLYLAVTHGIFSKGFDELKLHYKRIYSTDSYHDNNSDFRPAPPDYFKQISLKEL